MASSRYSGKSKGKQVEAGMETGGLYVGGCQNDDPF